MDTWRTCKCGSTQDTGTAPTKALYVNVQRRARAITSRREAPSYQLHSNRCRVAKSPEHLMKYNEHEALGRRVAIPCLSARYFRYLTENNTQSLAPDAARANGQERSRGPSSRRTSSHVTGMNRWQTSHSARVLCSVPMYRGPRGPRLQPKLRCSKSRHVQGQMAKVCTCSEARSDRVALPDSATPQHGDSESMGPCTAEIKPKLGLLHGESSEVPYPVWATATGAPLGSADTCHCLHPYHAGPRHKLDDGHLKKRNTWASCLAPAKVCENLIRHMVSGRTGITWQRASHQSDGWRWRDHSCPTDIHRPRAKTSSQVQLSANLKSSNTNGEKENSKLAIPLVQRRHIYTMTYLQAQIYLNVSETKGQQVWSINTPSPGQHSRASKRRPLLGIAAGSENHIRRRLQSELVIHVLHRAKLHSHQRRTETVHDDACTPNVNTVGSTALSAAHGAWWGVGWKGKTICRGPVSHWHFHHESVSQRWLTKPMTDTPYQENWVRYLIADSRTRPSLPATPPYRRR